MGTIQRHVMLNPKALKHIHIAVLGRQAQQLQAQTKRPDLTSFEWGIIVAQKHFE